MLAEQNRILFCSVLLHGSLVYWFNIRKERILYANFQSTRKLGNFPKEILIWFLKYFPGLFFISAYFSFLCCDDYYLIKRNWGILSDLNFVLFFINLGNYIERLFGDCLKKQEYEKTKFQILIIWRWKAFIFIHAWKTLLPDFIFEKF